MFLGMWESVREWTSTLMSELPLWELESRWTPKFSKNNRRGKNSLDWKFHNIIEKILERKCLKWACMTHLGTYNTSYSQKIGWESNCQFWLLTIKIQESPWFLCVLVTCHIPVKSSWGGLQICFRPHFNWRSSHKVMGFQSCKSPNFGNFRTPSWESHDKMIFGCWPRGHAQIIL
jgi:hypothetical protein